ncbi:hypothetical protein GLUCOINTEAF2_0200632 [Komagataeibacter intermedius AF2]|uniref:Uncharacterized protein n=1 Tax=Komagataeibacter intermedius AF2 TaxID=1458464 RepID=A0A0N0MFF7_9PROT|nr:hypothetical protein GLUCOINTEAF2_0200632 [Komagataeibacter intermedius AF2]
MWTYLRRQRLAGIPRTGWMGRWDIAGPALIAAAFALSTAMIFLF